MKQKKVNRARKPAMSGLPTKVVGDRVMMVINSSTPIVYKVIGVWGGLISIIKDDGGRTRLGDIVNYFYLIHAFPRGMQQMIDNQMIVDHAIVATRCDIDCMQQSLQDHVQRMTAETLAIAELYGHEAATIPTAWPVPNYTPGDQLRRYSPWGRYDLCERIFGSHNWVVATNNRPGLRVHPPDVVTNNNNSHHYAAAETEFVHAPLDTRSLTLAELNDNRRVIDFWINNRRQELSVDEAHLSALVEMYEQLRFAMLHGGDDGGSWTPLG